MTKQTKNISRKLGLIGLLTAGLALAINPRDAGAQHPGAPWAAAGMQPTTVRGEIGKQLIIQQMNNAYYNSMLEEQTEQLRQSQQRQEQVFPEQQMNTKKVEQRSHRLEDRYIGGKVPLVRPSKGDVITQVALDVADLWVELYSPTLKKRKRIDIDGENLLWIAQNYRKDYDLWIKPRINSGINEFQEIYGHCGAGSWLKGSQKLSEALKYTETELMKQSAKK